jgi:hypothetical protein
MVARKEISELKDACEAKLLALAWRQIFRCVCSVAISIHAVCRARHFGVHQLFPMKLAYLELKGPSVLQITVMDSH